LLGLESWWLLALTYLDLAALVTGKERASPPSTGLKLAASLECGGSVALGKPHELGDEGVDVIAKGVAGLEAIVGGRSSHGAHGSGGEEERDDGLGELHFDGWVLGVECEEVGI